MPPKATTAKGQPDPKTGVLIVPSKAYSQTYNTIEKNAIELEGFEETEIAAQIFVPEEGGWGWVVVASSFFNIFIVDGIYFSFGAIFQDMTDDLKSTQSLVALINSIAVAMYFVGGPLVSALINRFGFRAITMSGSVICSIAFLCSYFSIGYVTLIVFYGFVGGIGASMINMAGSLVVGFYFERLRSLALSIAGVGSSVGIMVMFTVNTYTVKLAGWRITTLMHSGLFGLVYFLGMTYRPVLSLTVTKTTEDPTRTVTYLPSLAAIKTSPSRTRKEGTMPSAAERLFSAVSNAHFPTAATVVEEGVAHPTTLTTTAATTQAGPSTAGVSRLTLTAQGKGGISRRQLKQVQSIISRTSVQDKKNVEVTVNIEPSKKRSFWQRLCHWEEHVHESRPMYRDDAFYDGRLKQLPAYQKSVVDVTPEARTGLEYQMAVSRAVTAADLGEKRGVFTTAVRRILATMMDPKLLKRVSFLLLCSSGFFTYLGYLVPYVFLADRNMLEGIPIEHCHVFVSVIGFANAVGRIVTGALACKICPLKLYCMACIMAGAGIILFNFSFNLYYQYVICVLFGFYVASLSSIRAMVIVKLFGLDMLTNATGIMILFQGLGSLISTPLCSKLKDVFGYAVAFYVAGVFVVIGGIVLFPVNKINAREKDKESSASSAKHHESQKKMNEEPTRHSATPQNIVDESTKRPVPLQSK